jgi:hypothetical protein
MASGDATGCDEGHDAAAGRWALSQAQAIEGRSSPEAEISTSRQFAFRERTLSK